MIPNNVWIIIPAYNEANNISRVLESLLKQTKNIVVIDDCSQDQTIALVKKYPVYLVKHQINRGQGAALQTGHDFALKKGAEIVVHFDADGQMQVKDIPKIIEPIIKEQVDVVFGSRFLGAKSKIPWTKKYLILKPAIIFNWLMTGIKLSDVHNGFRALSAKALKKIRFQQDRMAHATEILELIRQADLKYTEVPVEIIYNQYGQGMVGGLKIIRDLILAKILK